MHASTSQASKQPPLRAVILTALRVEYMAVRRHLSELKEEIHPRGTIYERGTFWAKGQRWEVGMVQVGAGNPQAALEAERAIEHFEPSVLFFVGVAGGMKDVRLGDVVAADKIMTYEFGKAEKIFRERADGGPLSYPLVQRARAEGRKDDWLQRLGDSGPNPAPRVFVGPIAAGQKVVASTESPIWQRLRATYGDVLAVEMEGYGFLRAAHASSEVKALVIRGISDLIEGKSEADAAGWQEIASHHASGFAFEVLAKWTPESTRPDLRTEQPLRPIFSDKLATQQGPHRQNNPFYYTSPVEPVDFVGRWPLVKQIVADLSQSRADSWVIIGGRRFGKSSVLKAIHSRLSEQSRQRSAEERQVLPLIIDLKGCDTRSEQHIYACIARQLYRTLHRDPTLSINVDLSTLRLGDFANYKIDALSFYKFEELLYQLVRHVKEDHGPLRLIFLLDEAEFTVQFAWSDTLFNQLRSLIYDGALSKSVKLVLTGSARVVQVRKEGSPLLNALKSIHLQPLSTSNINELIAHGGTLPRHAATTVQNQSGGHPFIAQYLLHHLWHKGFAQAIPAQIEQLARQMRQERAADLRGWSDAIGDSGQRAYAILAQHNDWLDEHLLLTQIRNTTQPADQGLIALCYHGLIVRSEDWQQYRVNGTLFQKWFRQNIRTDFRF